jgi:hypothetical protein
MSQSAMPIAAPMRQMRIGRDTVRDTVAGGAGGIVSVLLGELYTKTVENFSELSSS